MTPDEVSNSVPQIGPITARHADEDGTINEYRAMDFPNFGYRDGKLVFIGASWRVKDVQWNGLDIYASKTIDVLRAFEHANGGAAQIFGVPLFEKLGLQLPGFYLFERSEAYDPASVEQDDRGLTVWDRAAQQKTLSEVAEHIRHATFL